MKYKLTKRADAVKVEKFGIKLDVYPSVENCGIVTVSTDTGHNQEFYDTKSTFTYLILEGSGSYFLDDEEVRVAAGDMISIPPKTRIYYKGKMKLVLLTTPAWKQENEVETRPKIW